MALASRFEELRAWQAARELTLQVYALARRERLKRDFALADQLRRAAVSTMNNVAEGFDSASRAEFTRFLRYASRSASEVQSCLYVASDQGYIDPADFDSLYRQAASVRKLCVALIRSLNRPSSRSGQVNEPAAPYGTPSPSVTGHRSPVTGHAVGSR